MTNISGREISPQNQFSPNISSTCRQTLGDAWIRPRRDTKTPANEFNSKFVLSAVVREPDRRSRNVASHEMGTLSLNPWDLTLYGQNGNAENCSGRKSVRGCLNGGDPDAKGWLPIRRI